jgi:hypothetical protein
MVAMAEVKTVLHYSAVRHRHGHAHAVPGTAVPGVLPQGA